jgi:hypothetical protein
LAVCHSAISLEKEINCHYPDRLGCHYAYMDHLAI